MKLPSVLPSVRKSAIKGGASPAPYIGSARFKGGAPFGALLVNGRALLVGGKFLTVA